MTPPFHTDKVEPHGYFQSYARLAGILGPAARVCELGVQDGESLKMWQCLFPCGEITGVDISEGCTWPEGTVKVVCSQDDPLLPVSLAGMYDLIVDDASHDGPATTAAFGNLWPLLRPGGFYVVEDWAVGLRGDPHWGNCWGDGMLRAAESFLRLLSHRDGECESIEYRYGMILLHKRSGE